MIFAAKKVEEAICIIVSSLKQEAIGGTSTTKSVRVPSDNSTQKNFYKSSRRLEDVFRMVCIESKRDMDS